MKICAYPFSKCVNVCNSLHWIIEDLVTTLSQCSDGGNVVTIPGWSVVSLSSDMNLSGCMSQFLLPPLWAGGGNYGRNLRQLHDYCHVYNCLVGALLS